MLVRSNREERDEDYGDDEDDEVRDKVERGGGHRAAGACGEAKEHDDDARERDCAQGARLEREGAECEHGREARGGKARGGRPAAAPRDDGKEEAQVREGHARHARHAGVEEREREHRARPEGTKVLHGGLLFPHLTKKIPTQSQSVTLQSMNKSCFQTL